VRERPPASGYGPARLLLDTHAWLWWQSGDRRLGSRARQAVLAAPAVLFSAASAWEIAIKTRLGKLTLPKGASIEEQLALDGFESLAVTLAHAEAVRALPALHRDPFDRMLVAQASEEDLVILTKDPQIRQYDVRVMAADE
jgi:PIN domain nuclease of toxin-antitoxin system